MFMITLDFTISFLINPLIDRGVSIQLRPQREKGPVSFLD